MARDEEDLVAAIERFTGKAIPRVILPNFDYRRTAPRSEGRRPARSARARAAESDADPEASPETVVSSVVAARSFGRGKGKDVAPDRRRR
jgi:hypothetical protein